MKKLLIATATLALLTGSAFAQDRDYTDKETYSCNKETVEGEMTALAENGRAGRMGISLIYVKSSVETNRKAKELTCKVTVVYSVGTISGTFRFYEQDGHNLVAFKPER